MELKLDDDNSAIFKFVQMLLQQSASLNKFDLARRIWDTTYTITYEEDHELGKRSDELFTLTIPPAFVTVPKDSEGCSLQDVLNLVSYFYHLASPKQEIEIHRVRYNN